MTEKMIFVWLGITIVFAVLEAATAQLTTIWFAIGSVAALILAICGVESITVQCVVFAAVSLVTLIATRPFVKKLLHKHVQPTNADRYIGETGVTLAEINNVQGTGEVKVQGNVWTARTENDAVIPAGANVRVLRIEGVKVIVEQI